MAVMGMRWPEPTVRALPRLVSTFQFETVDSFITRLAHANHVAPRDLRTHVGRADSHRVERLGTLSGYAPAVLRTRLRGLSTVDGHATRQRAHSRPACRWCSARRGANEPVHAGFLTMSPSATAISGGSARPHKPGQTKLISPLTVQYLPPPGATSVCAASTRPRSSMPPSTTPCESCSPTATLRITRIRSGKHRRRTPMVDPSPRRPPHGHLPGYRRPEPRHRYRPAPQLLPDSSL